VDSAGAADSDADSEGGKVEGAARPASATAGDAKHAFTATRTLAHASVRVRVGLGYHRVRVVDDPRGPAGHCRRWPGPHTGGSRRPARADIRPLIRHRRGRPPDSQTNSFIERLRQIALLKDSIEAGILLGGNGGEGGGSESTAATSRQPRSWQPAQLQRLLFHHWRGSHSVSQSESS
jgi:hypothetical protein